MSTATMATAHDLGAALVTGASGFIGSHLVEVLRERGIAVRAADLPGADLAAARALGCETATIALDDHASLAAACRGIGTVFHVAAIFDFRTPWEKLLEVNVAGARRLAECAADAGVRRLLYFSSVGVYGRPTERFMPENGPKRPRNGYERSKWLGEQAVMEVARQRALETVAIRPTLVYGPRSRFGHAVMLAILSLRASARSPRPLPTVAGGGLVHSVHVRDVAEAAYLVALRGTSGESYNVADRSPLPLGDFVTALAASVSLPARPIVRYRAWLFRPLLGGLRAVIPRLVPRWDARLLALWRRRAERHGLEDAIRVGLDPEWLDYLADDHAYDVSKLESLGFTWTHPELRRGLADTVAWYHGQRWLPPPTADATERTRPAPTERAAAA